MTWCAVVYTSSRVAALHTAPYTVSDIHTHTQYHVTRSVRWCTWCAVVYTSSRVAAHHPDEEDHS